jgi:hypothetical protein
MDIVHKQVSLVHHVPSSESFQAFISTYSYLFKLTLKFCFGEGSRNGYQVALLSFQLPSEVSTEQASG